MKTAGRKPVQVRVLCPPLHLARRRTGAPPCLPRNCLDLFCQDVAAGVRQWEHDVLRVSTDILGRLAELVSIHPVPSTFPF